MADKISYIRKVESQLNSWKSEIRELSERAGQSNRKDVDRIYEARHLVENKLKELRITGDEVLGHWETEIDNLCHQVNSAIKTARNTIH